MGLTNSEILEEILYKCYELKIIDKVREEVKTILTTNQNISTLEAYEIVYAKYNNLEKNDLSGQQR